MQELYKDLLEIISSGSRCIMLTWLHIQRSRTGYIEKKILLKSEDIEQRLAILSEDIYKGINCSLETGKLQTINIQDDKFILIEPFIPKPRLIIFGGGHIAKPLSEFASKVGFSITLIDDRPFFANKERFPGTEKVICESFERSFDSIKLRESDYAVIITRGHRHDGVVLREILKYDLNYIGMIGSKRRVKGMMEELLKEGYPKKKLDLVNAPIGLNIAAVTPEEIAISITAQLISFKNNGDSKITEKKSAFPEFNVEVIEKVYEEIDIPKALITVLNSKGSVPRKAGAKMLAYYDGRTFGSIGGGCSESGILLKSRDLMPNKGFMIEHIDMTGDVSESESMACGGTMEVLIEVF